MQEDSYNKLSAAGKTISTILRHKADSMDDLMVVCPNATTACVNTVPNNPASSCCSELHSELVAFSHRTQAVSAGIYSVAHFQALTTDEWVQKHNKGCSDLMTGLNRGDHSNFSSMIEWYKKVLPVGTGFVDTLGGGDGTCGHGCPDLLHSLCRNRTCIIPTCEHAKPHCQEYTTAGQRARMLCPTTCGCSDPSFPLLLSGQGFGCGPSCKKIRRYMEAEAALPCVDTTPSSPEMSSYAKQLAAGLMHGGSSTLTEAQAKSFRTFLIQHGCNAILEWAKSLISLPTEVQQVMLKLLRDDADDDDAAVLREYLFILQYYNASTSSFDFSLPNFDFSWLDGNMSSWPTSGINALFAKFQEFRFYLCGGSYAGEEFGVLQIDAPLQSLSVLCPMTCGCTEKLGPHGWTLRNCPSSCQKEQLKSQPKDTLEIVGAKPLTACVHACMCTHARAHALARPHAHTLACMHPRT